MSLTSKKGESRANGRASQVLGAATQQVTPITQQVVPMAKNAGQAARQGVEGAARWARPRVEGARSWAEPQVRMARSWAAPRVEQAGLAVRDKIAPSVSAALVEASHRLDAQPSPQRRHRLWPRLVAAGAMLAAAVSAAAAVILKRQGDTPAEDQVTDEGGMPSATHPGGATPAAGGTQRDGDGAIDSRPPTS